MEIHVGVGANIWLHQAIPKPFITIPTQLKMLGLRLLGAGSAVGARGRIRGNAALVQNGGAACGAAVGDGKRGTSLMFLGGF